PGDVHAHAHLEHRRPPDGDEAQGADLTPLASIEDVVFHLSSALRVPVLVAALAAFVLVLAEAAALFVELARRRGRNARSVEAAARGARAALVAGNRRAAAEQLAAVASSRAMWDTFEQLLAHAGPDPEASTRMSKCLANFDIQSIRRLERTRMLVRFG